MQPWRLLPQALRYTRRTQMALSVHRCRSSIMGLARLEQEHPVATRSPLDPTRLI